MGVYEAYYRIRRAFEVMHILSMPLRILPIWFGP